MLHIDRTSQRYFDEMDRAFKTTPLISTGLKRELSKVLDDIEDDWEKDYRRINKGVNSFNRKLIRALSDPIPSSYVGKPRPMLRKFPFKNKGDLVDSYQPMQTTYKWNSNNSMTITAEGGGFGSSHAYMTNYALNSSRNVHWLHWIDNIFEARLPTGEQHSVKVPDIRSVLIGIYG